MDFDFTAISQDYTHFSQHCPTIIFGLNKIIVLVFADFATPPTPATNKRKIPTLRAERSEPGYISGTEVSLYIHIITNYRTYQYRIRPQDIQINGTT